MLSSNLEFINLVSKNYACDIIIHEQNFIASVLSEVLSNGGRKQKHLFPVGTKLYFHVNVLTQFHCFHHQRDHHVMWFQTENNSIEQRNLNIILD